MSGQPSTRPKVPEGETKYYTTRQMEANDKGFVGYEINWKPMQKVAEYSKPKTP